MPLLLMIGLWACKPPPDDVQPDLWRLHEAIDDSSITEGLFRHDFVHRVRLEIPPNSMSQLQPGATQYVAARIEIDEHLMEVGIRLKGTSTAVGINQKASLKVDLNWSEPAGGIFGVDKFNLHSQIADDSFMGEVLAYEMFRSWEVPSPRTGYTAVWINDEFRGLYTIVEEKDKEWLEQWYDDPQGTLFEGEGCDLDGASGWGGPDCWEVDQLGVTDSPQDILALHDALDTSGEPFWQNLDANVDRRLMIDMLAGEMVTGHWDSYGGNLNNYHLYHEPTTGLWSLTPWSTDLAFGRPWGGNCNQTGQSASQYQVGLLASRCAGQVACRDERDARALEMLDGLEVNGFSEKIDEIEALIADVVAVEPGGPSTSSWQGEVTCMRAFLGSRRTQLNLQ